MTNGIFVLINVDNVEKTLAFYKSIGLKTSTQTMGPMTWGSVDSGDASIVVHSKHDPNADAETKAWLAGPLGKGVVLNVAVTNATKHFEKAQAAGAIIDRPLEDAPWGGKVFGVSDPDGYVVMIQDKFPGAQRTKKAASRKPAKRVRPAKAKKARGNKRR